MNEFDHALSLLTNKRWPAIVRASKVGDINSLYLQGVAYLCGGPVKIDLQKSYTFFKKAADGGHADAAFRVGVLLKEYDWPLKPEDDPFLYFNLAAQNGSAAGSVALGNKITFYLLENFKRWHSFYMPSSFYSLGDEALSYYAKGMSHLYSPAFYFTGLHYLNGWGAKKSVQKALDLFKYGALLDDIDCNYMCFQLSHKYNKAEALPFLTVAADKGHADAQYLYSAYILDGSLEGHSDEEAITWLRRAAMQRHPGAMGRLGSLYYHGRGVTKNLRDAYTWAYRAQHMGVECKSLLSAIWKLMDEDDKIFIQSQSFEFKNKDFFGLSDKLFGVNKFTLN